MPQKKSSSLLDRSRDPHPRWHWPLYSYPPPLNPRITIMQKLYNFCNVVTILYFYSLMYFLSFLYRSSIFIYQSSHTHVSGYIVYIVYCIYNCHFVNCSLSQCMHLNHQDKFLVGVLAVNLFPILISDSDSDSGVLVWSCCPLKHRKIEVNLTARSEHSRKPWTFNSDASASEDLGLACMKTLLTHLWKEKNCPNTGSF